jgi:hypothetical protein
MFASNLHVPVRDVRWPGELLVDAARRYANGLDGASYTQGCVGCVEAAHDLSHEYGAAPV